MKNLFGALLRQWRKTRNVSQLELAMNADISQRHVSFIESGRARPSREMVLKLAETMAVPLRARNEILLAAGYAPFYPERPLNAPELTLASQLLVRLLEHHDPYPAMVLDREWNILRQNKSALHLIAKCLPKKQLARFSQNGKLNFLRVMCAPGGLRDHIRSWARTGPALLARLRREAMAYPGSPSIRLMEELLQSGAFPGFIESGDAPADVVIPLEIMVDGASLRFFSMLTTFGAPQDITLQELHVEMSFPADEATDRLLRACPLQ